MTVADLPQANVRPLSATDAETYAAHSAFVAQSLGTDAAVTLTEGQVLGNYRIVRLLGRGGMGQVYEADHLASGRRVALKLLRHELKDDDRARFLREGQMAAAISHPHAVYVYGTEDIGGVPVISMELATNGTLHDMVEQHGPLAPAKAVALTLQIVSGLAAAARVGVLHRDVKPHNCFLDANGGVKVGDFGLSVGSGSTDETQLTVAGTILGTPAYAAPEQLRGERVDLRADIYSVGATLFYLLTGKAPFEGGNLVQILSRVMQETPPSVRTIRRDTPSAVARVVARCLAKTPSDRYQTYEDLEHGLEQCTSGVAVAATLGRRTVAGAADLVVVWLLTGLAWALLPGATLSGSLGHATIAQKLAGLLVGIAYFAGFEHRLGASPAKKLLGLRVMRIDGGVAPIRALILRAVLFVLAVRGLGVLCEAAFGWDTSLFLVLGTAALFVLARRDNGWLGLHERFSKTRAIRRGRAERREAASVASEVAATSAAVLAKGACAQIGQFLVPADQEWRPGTTVLGYDPALARSVWIRPADVGAPPAAAARRDLARPTRLRWIAGERSAQIAWDAYEAPGGTALVDPQLGSMPWPIVRGWLVALTEEIIASANEPDRPELRLDRLWATSGGSVKLLEWPGDGCSEQSAALDPQVFLANVARTALGSRGGADQRRDASPTPAHAWRFFERLAAARVPTLERVATELREFAAWPTKVSRTRRALHLAPAGLIPLVAFGVSTYFAIHLMRLPADQRENLLAMRALVAQSQREKDNARAEQALVLAATRLDKVSGTAAGQLRAGGWKDVRSMLTGRAARADKSQVARAETMFAEVVSHSRDLASSLTWPVTYVATQTFDAIGSLAWMAVACAFLLRGGFFFGPANIALMSRRGGRAPRWRAGWRALVAWSPVLLVQAAVVALGRVINLPPGEQLLGALHAAALLVMLAGGIWAVMRPTDSLQDRLARTFVVRR
ncbi:MAG: protein kinase domain-containing protein [Bacteroidales bacterium]